MWPTTWRATGTFRRWPSSRAARSAVAFLTIVSFTCGAGGDEAVAWLTRHANMTATAMAGHRCAFIVARRPHKPSGAGATSDSAQRIPMVMQRRSMLTGAGTAGLGSSLAEVSEDGASEEGVVGYADVKEGLVPSSSCLHWFWCENLCLWNARARRAKR